MKGYISEGFISVQGEGALAGKVQYFLRLAGCSLKCRSCDTKYAWGKRENFDLFHRGGKLKMKNPVDAGELAHLLNSLRGKGKIPASISITGGEPLEQAEFLGHLLSHLEGFEVLLETNGLHPEIPDEIMKKVDFFSVDIKIPSFTGKKINYRFHEAFLKKVKKEGKWGYIKIPYTLKSTEGEIKRALDTVERSGIKWTVYLQPFRPSCFKKGVSTIQRLSFPHNLRVLPQIHKLLAIK